MSLALAGILLGALVSVIGLGVAWHGASEDEARAQRDVETAARLAEQERAEAEALPAGHSVEDARRVQEASEARYAAADLDRPSYDNLSALALLARVRVTRRSKRDIRVGLGITALGAVISTVTALVGL